MDLDANLSLRYHKSCMIVYRSPKILSRSKPITTKIYYSLTSAANSGGGAISTSCGLTYRIADGATMAQSDSETEALERGMEEKAVEFRQAGAEVYRKL